MALALTTATTLSPLRFDAVPVALAELFQARMASWPVKPTSELAKQGPGVNVRAAGLDVIALDRRTCRQNRQQHRRKTRKK